MMMLQECLRAVEQAYLKAGPFGRLACAVSGGQDSVALLHLLWHLKKQYGFSLCVLHVHHGLRKESDEEAAFVEALCGSLGVSFFMRRVAVAGDANVEARAREARYQALFDMANEQEAVLTLAHHMDDQAETVLMHLSYGAGNEGLAGMRLYRDGKFRPLLKLTKRQIAALCSEEGYIWREDASNQSERFTRNRLRLSVLPALETVYPAFRQAVAQAADLAAAEADYWQATAAAWCRAHGQNQHGFVWVDRRQIQREHIALQRQVIKYLLTQCRHPVTFERVEALQMMAQGQDRGTAFGGKILLTPSRMHFAWPKVGELLPGTVNFFENSTILGDGVFTQALDADMMKGVVLRTRLPGDVFYPLGASGPQKLKQTLIDKKIDRPFKDSWPLLCRGHEVLWLVGYGPGQTAAVNQNTRRLILAQYDGVLPDGRKRTGGGNHGKPRHSLSGY